MADTLIHGTRRRGHRHGMAKLTEAQVLRIRLIAAETLMTHAEIGDQFGVSDGTIWDIIHRRYWTHI